MSLIIFDWYLEPETAATSCPLGFLSECLPVKQDALRQALDFPRGDSQCLKFPLAASAKGLFPLQGEGDMQSLGLQRGTLWNSKHSYQGLFIEAIS